MSLINIPPRTILPLMIFIGVMIVGVRVGDVWDSLTTGKLFAAVQQVQASGKEGKPSDAPAKKESQETKTAPAATTASNTKVPKEEPTPEPESMSAESALYKQLAGRRDQLDKRETEIKDREALAAITEQRVDQKIKELQILRQQLQKMVGQASGAQQAQLENLVKIYEIMKPKEAAKIFETMELPVLLDVVQKMKPARTAAVLAEMNPQKAKDITIALTQQDQLPKVK